MNPQAKAQLQLAAMALLIGVQLGLIARAAANLDRARELWRTERAAYAALADRVDDARRFLAPVEGPAEVETPAPGAASPPRGTGGRL
jgi:hypothetical protein